MNGASQCASRETLRERFRRKTSHCTGPLLRLCSVMPAAIGLDLFEAVSSGTLAALISELGYNKNMKIEWDPKKARLNLRKHKVSFEEAATAMSDPMAATGNDPDHSMTEDRYITFGVSGRGRLLVVAHTEEDETI